MPQENFADRLIAAIRDKQTPLVVGLDPRHERIPFAAASSRDPFAKAADYGKFCIEIINAIHELIPAVKPQAAFFEQLGPSGMVALGNVINFALEKDLVVILDGKRGDIGSTAQAYAAGWLDRSETGAWKCDALTVNPYLGDDALEPFVNTAVEHQAGLFVLVKTSNPGGQVFQDWPAAEPLYKKVAHEVEALAERTVGQGGYGSVGAVVGATHPEQLAELRESMRHSLFLVPGLGAQGGTAADVAGAFDEHGLGAVVNSSRGIIFAHENPEYESCSDWLDAVKQATTDTIQALATHTSAGKLVTGSPTG